MIEKLAAACLGKKLNFFEKLENNPSVEKPEGKKLELSKLLDDLEKRPQLKKQEAQNYKQKCCR